MEEEDQVPDLYKTTVRAVGGRTGRVTSDDGLLDFELSLPQAMGGSGKATNPEQLFAAGYAACFENAVILVARRMGETVSDNDVEVAAQVGIGPKAGGGFQLSVSLDIVIVGVVRETAEKVVAAAHAACPYSNAVRGNIEVGLNVSVR
jgi:Ohr subfamily peroxiredoxin